MIKWPRLPATLSQHPPHVGPHRIRPRAYREIVDRAGGDVTRVARSVLRIWLANDVCTAVEGYSAAAELPGPGSLGRAGDMVSGAATPQERRIVEAADTALVGCPAASDGWPPYRRSSKDSDDTLRGQPETRTRPRIWPLKKGRWRLADRFWTDLVCPGDYLHPQGGWMRRERGPSQTAESRRPTNGDFVLSINPALHAVGDFVSRCLLRRSR